MRLEEFRKRDACVPFLVFAILLSLLTACQSKSEVQPVAARADTLNVKSAKDTVQQQQALNHLTANKGKIEAISEIPVCSRLAEQIVMFAIENTGQYVKKGQVVARLNDAPLREKILLSRAKLEKAEYQYKAILMGQGYKHGHLDDAPDNLKKVARINSGYNVAKAELQELELELSYCTIVAPVSGYVLKIQNTLYGAARPGEPLFSIVDIDHLKVSFDVLENELAKYEMGATVSATTVAFPNERHPATITAVSPVIDENGMIHVEATLKPHPHLLPGMTAFVTISAL